MSLLSFITRHNKPMASAGEGLAEDAQLSLTFPSPALTLAVPACPEERRLQTLPAFHKYCSLAVA